MIKNIEHNINNLYLTIWFLILYEVLFYSVYVLPVRDVRVRLTWFSLDFLMGKIYF